MTARHNPFSRIRLVYRRSSTLLKCVVLTALILCTICLMALRGSILEAQAAAEVLRSQAAQLEEENAALTQHIAELGTVQSVKRIAREELGLVTPDTVFFLPSDSIPQ